MPTTITHAFFAKDIYDILPENIHTKVNLNRFKMLSQSTDSLLFYNLFSFFPGKKIRKFQGYFHTHKTQEFFINLLKYIRENKIEDEDVYSFVIGFICHYVLDKNVHPYVVYRTGLVTKGKPSTYKYRNIHDIMEAYFDMDMVQRRLQMNPYHYRFTEYCFDTRPFSEPLKRTIYDVFYHTFGVKDMDQIYYKSLKQMKTALGLFRMDRFGIKRFIYQLVDTFTPKGAFRFESISYHLPLEDKHNFLNNHHSTWRHPAIYDQTSTESFVDLYLKSMKEAKVIIRAAFDYLEGKDIDLTKVFENTSYLSGLDCDDPRELKYFAF